MNIPNFLTIVRFFLIPVIGFLMYSKDPNYVLASLVIFVFAVFTDWLDGYIARNYNKKTTFGTFFDPLVDKMLILTMLFLFVDLDMLPLWMILLVLFREFLVTGVRQVCSKPKKIVGANWMGKTKFIMQALVIIYIQLLIYFNLSELKVTLFNETIAFYFALLMTIVSITFALNFLYWYKKELLSDI